MLFQVTFQFPQYLRVWNGGWYVISTPVSNIDINDFVNIVGVFDNNNILLYVKWCFG